MGGWWTAVRQPRPAAHAQAAQPRTGSSVLNQRPVGLHPQVAAAWPGHFGLWWARGQTLAAPLPLHGQGSAVPLSRRQGAGRLWPCSVQVAPLPSCVECSVGHGDTACQSQPPASDGAMARLPVTHKQVGQGPAPSRRGRHPQCHHAYQYTI